MTLSFLMYVIGLVVLGYAALRLTKQLADLYPFRVRCKYWWSKYVPGMGFFLVLVAGQEVPILMVIGIITILSGFYFLKEGQRQFPKA